MKFKTFLNETSNQKINFYKSRSHISDLKDIKQLSDLNSRIFSGVMDFSNNEITTLEGLPDKYVYEMLDASSNRNLISLKGCPDEINGMLLITTCNKLSSLEFCATSVHDDFNISLCSLTSLEYAPKYIGGDFCVELNKISSLIGVDDYLDIVKGNLMLDSNPITEGGLGLLLTKVHRLEALAEAKSTVGNNLFRFVRVMIKYMHSGKNRASTIYECQQELINNNLEDFAQL